MPERQDSSQAGLTKEARQPSRVMASDAGFRSSTQPASCLVFQASASVVARGRSAHAITNPKQSSRTNATLAVSLASQASASPPRSSGSRFRARNRPRPASRPLRVMKARRRAGASGAGSCWRTMETRQPPAAGPGRLSERGGRHPASWRHSLRRCSLRYRHRCRLQRCVTQPVFRRGARSRAARRLRRTCRRTRGSAGACAVRSARAGAARRRASHSRT